MELVISNNFKAMNEYELLEIDGGSLFGKVLAGVTGSLLIIGSPFIGAIAGVVAFPTGPLSLAVAVGVGLTTAGQGFTMLDYAFSK